jgi:hypothetical protein
VGIDRGDRAPGGYGRVRRSGPDWPGPDRPGPDRPALVCMQGHRPPVRRAQGECRSWRLRWAGEFCGQGDRPGGNRLEGAIFPSVPGEPRQLGPGWSVVDCSSLASAHRRLLDASVDDPHALVRVGPADERAGYAKGQARSGRDGAGLVGDADRSRAVGDRVPGLHLQRPDRTPPVPGDHPRGLRTPRTPILPLCPCPPAGAGGLLCLRWHLSGGLW